MLVAGTTTVTVTLTQGDDVTRNGTEDQITGSVPVAWTSNGTSLTATVAAGTTLTGSYNDGGSAVGFIYRRSNYHSKTLLWIQMAMLFLSFFLVMD